MRIGDGWSRADDDWARTPPVESLCHTADSFRPLFVPPLVDLFAAHVDSGTFLLLDCLVAEKVDSARVFLLVFLVW